MTPLWLHTIEDLLLCGNRKCFIDEIQSVQATLTDETDRTLVSLLSLIQRGLYSQVLSHPYITGNLVAHITDLTNSPHTYHSELAVLCAAVAALNVFVSNNYVGPVDERDNALVAAAIDNTHITLPALAIDGEDVYENALTPNALAFARALLQSAKTFTHCRTAVCWSLRAVRYHQALLDHQSQTLKSMIDELLPLTLSTQHSVHPQWLTAMKQLESAILYRRFWQYSASKQALEAARTALAITVDMTGAMGKRTRWQSEKKPQLYVATLNDETKSNRDDVVSNTDYESDSSRIMPTPIDMSSDVLLDTLALDDAITSKRLNAIERSLLLGILDDMTISTPTEHSTTQTEMNAFVQAILASGQRSYAVESYALYRQALLQVRDHHRVDRAIAQLEDLAITVTRPPAQNDIDVSLLHSVRIDDVYQMDYPSIWSLQREIAGVFTKNGMTKSALELYESMRWYDGIIEMLILLGRHTEAETIIRQRLTQQETPKLYCLLGDVLNDPQQYEHAWTLSHESYPRAQRSLARYYRLKSEYTIAIKHYQLALSINSIFPMEWFALGHCALSVKDYTLAIHAFNQTMVFDPEYADAYNNLAAAHIYLHNYHSAFTALEFAVKLKYESWKVWENYLYIALRINEWSKAITAVTVILNNKLKEGKREDRDRYTQEIKNVIDDKCIEILTNVVCDEEKQNELITNEQKINNDENNNNNNNSNNNDISNNSLLYDRWSSTLKTASERLSGSAVVWRSLARLSALKKDTNSQISYSEKAVTALQESIDSWTYAQSFRLLTENVIYLCDAYLSDNSKTSLYAGKLLLNQIISRAQRSNNDTISRHPDIALLQANLQRITEAISSQTAASVDRSSSSSAFATSYLERFK